MSKCGPRFYDEASVFDTYWAHRATPDAPNQTMERPAFLELLGDPRGQDVLDLGCGDGGFGLERSGPAPGLGRR